MPDIEQTTQSVIVEPLRPFAVSPKQAAILENSALSVIYARLANECRKMARYD
jgi:hypothetical protein